MQSAGRIAGIHWTDRGKTCIRAIQEVGLEIAHAAHAKRAASSENSCEPVGGKLIDLGDDLIMHVGALLTR